MGVTVAVGRFCSDAISQTADVGFVFVAGTPIGVVTAVITGISGSTVVLGAIKWGHIDNNYGKAEGKSSD